MELHLSWRCPVELHWQVKWPVERQKSEFMKWQRTNERREDEREKGRAHWMMGGCETNLKCFLLPVCSTAVLVSHKFSHHIQCMPSGQTATRLTLTFVFMMFFTLCTKWLKCTKSSEGYTLSVILYISATTTERETEGEAKTWTECHLKISSLADSGSYDSQLAKPKWGKQNPCPSKL